MGKKIEMAGHRIGLLTVEYELDKRKNGSPIWVCLCDCGSFKEYSTSDLKCGRIKSCGCFNTSPRGPQNNLIGKRFGRLTVLGLSKTRNSHGEIQWECKCDCGNSLCVTTSNLNAGRNYCSHTCEYHPGRAIDLSGERFGYIVVIHKYKEHHSSGEHQRWCCKCDCGRTDLIYRSSELRSGRRKSCGCKDGFKQSRKKIYKVITGKDVAKNESVIFLDGNPRNQTEDNMYLVSHEVYNKALIAGCFEIYNPSLKLSAIKTCELQRKIYEVESIRKV